jgi:phage-related protein
MGAADSVCVVMIGSTVNGSRAHPLTPVVTYDYTILDVCKDRQSMRQTRPISWVKAARKDFERFPEEAKSLCWMALTIAAEGGKADIVKPLLGLGSAVFEIALPFRGNAFRVVYAVQLGDDIWVVHAFQKKSTQGIKTPKHEIDLVEQRLKRLKEALG